MWWLYQVTPASVQVVLTLAGARRPNSAILTRRSLGALSVDPDEPGDV
jgi:hypothetical protein